MNEESVVELESVHDKKKKRVKTDKKGRNVCFITNENRTRNWSSDLEEYMCMIVTIQSFTSCFNSPQSTMKLR